MQNKKLLIATRSKGKFPEIVAKLAGVPFDIVNLNEFYGLGFAKDLEVEEPAMTFEGNAIIKAMTYGKRCGCLTLADDSGLEVDALGGMPGVYTARYAPGTDEDRYRKLLDELKDVPQAERTARFRCFIAIYDPETDKVRTCDGRVEGVIGFEPIGEDGFGYDPVFFVPEIGKTHAQLTMEEKGLVSHRGRALEKAKALLLENF